MPGVTHPAFRRPITENYTDNWLKSSCNSLSPARTHSSFSFPSNNLAHFFRRETTASHKQRVIKFSGAAFSCTQLVKTLFSRSLPLSLFSLQLISACLPRPKSRLLQYSTEPRQPHLKARLPMHKKLQKGDLNYSSLIYFKVKMVIRCRVNTGSYYSIVYIYFLQFQPECHSTTTSCPLLISRTNISPVWEETHLKSLFHNVQQQHFSPNSPKCNGEE